MAQIWLDSGAEDVDIGSTEAMLVHMYSRVWQECGTRERRLGVDVTVVVGAPSVCGYDPALNSQVPSDECALMKWRELLPAG